MTTENATATTIGADNRELIVNGVPYLRADSVLPTTIRSADLLLMLVGERVFVRTVTMHYTGRLVSFDPDSIVLSDAAWIADSGRFHDALTTGKLNEVEPFLDDVIVGRGALVDITRWNHELPRTQK